MARMNDKQRLVQENVVREPLLFGQARSPCGPPPDVYSRNEHLCYTLVVLNCCESVLGCYYISFSRTRKFWSETVGTFFASIRIVCFRFRFQTRSQPTKTSPFPVYKHHALSRRYNWWSGCAQKASRKTKSQCCAVNFMQQTIYE